MPEPEPETEYGARGDHGGVVPWPTRAMAQHMVDGIRSRGGAAVLVSRSVVRSEWTEEAT